MFAVSVLLAGIFHGFAQDEETLEMLFNKVDRSIDILDIMDECVVTRNATLIIKRTLARARKESQRQPHAQQRSSTAKTQNHQQDPTVEGDPSDYAVDLSQMDGTEIDWANVELPTDASQQALFWAEWGHLLNDLGA